MTYRSPTNPLNRRRMLSRVFDLGTTNINVIFPRFVSELRAVSRYHKTDSVDDLITILQNWLAAEGVRADWTKWTDGDESNEKLREKRKQETDARLRQADEERRKQQAETTPFTERVAATRDRLGDF